MAEPSVPDADSSTDERATCWLQLIHRSGEKGVVWRVCQ